MPERKRFFSLKPSLTTSFELPSSHARVISIKFTKRESVSQWVSDKHCQWSDSGPIIREQFSQQVWTFFAYDTCSIYRGDEGRPWVCQLGKRKFGRGGGRITFVQEAKLSLRQNPGESCTLPHQPAPTSLLTNPTGEDSHGRLHFNPSLQGGQGKGSGEKSREKVCE